MVKKVKPEKGEQLELIDVAPKNAKPIIAIAREYKAVVTKRVKLTAIEVQLKEEIKDMVHKAKLKPLDDGSTRFTFDGVTVQVTPCDAKVKVTEE